MKEYRELNEEQLRQYANALRSKADKLLLTYKETDKDYYMIFSALEELQRYKLETIKVYVEETKETKDAKKKAKNNNKEIFEMKEED